MKYKLIAIVERIDNGTILRQNVRYLTEEEFNDNVKVSHILRNYMDMLGRDYYVLIDYYFGY